MSFKVLPLDIQFRVIVRYLFAAAVASAAGSRVDFGIPVWNLIGKSALAVLLYAGVLSFGGSSRSRLDGAIMAPDQAASHDRQGGSRRNA